MPLSMYFKYLHIFRPIKEFHVTGRTSDSTRNVHNRGIYCIQYKHGSYSIVLELAASASSFARSIEMKRRLPMRLHRVRAARNRDGLARESRTRWPFTRMPPTLPVAVECDDAGARNEWLMPSMSINLFLAHREDRSLWYARTQAGAYRAAGGLNLACACRIVNDVAGATPAPRWQ
jgi:hypothetical protein